MIEKIENINSFILSKILLKISALCLTCFIIFNCVFSSISANIDSNDLSKFSSIQRDVFSAVFFVSNAIEKINFSLTSEIITDTAAKQTGSANEEDKNIPNKNNDVIITCLQIQSELLKLQNVQTPYLFGYNILLYDYGTLFKIHNDFYKNIVCVFIAFLFFSSIKKLYDSILNFNINRENPAFMYI